MMSRLILSIFSLVSNGVLLLFTLRRWLFLLTAWRLETSPPPPCSPAPLPPLLLLVPFRDEAANLRQLLPMIARLEYPAECLTVVLVDDGSGDGSGRFCQRFTSRRPNWHLLTLPRNVGKAAALNEALRRFPQGDFVAVFDADERPSPHTLSYLLAAFTNILEASSRLPAHGLNLREVSGRVGAVNGRRAVHNPLASPIASYAAFENLVHQLITNCAKDKLQLAPAILGSNCLYRREALTAVGNFTPNALLEDSDLTVRLAKAGWRTRFVPAAISSHAVPETVRGYWHQHTRWNVGFQQVAQAQTTAVLSQSRLPWQLRLELALFSLGYLDRVALLVAVVGWWQRPSRLTGCNIGLSLLTPFLQIIYVLRLTRAPALLWRRLGYLPLFYLLDSAAALASLLQKLIRKPVQWQARSIP